MQIGVIIERGIKDWQIIQQIGGFGKIHLSGRYIKTIQKNPVHVWVRLVYENTGEPLIFWLEADIQENNEWSAVLENIPAGGLYRIDTCLKEDSCPYFADALRGDIVHHIGVGDLFVIAGQSNASGYGKDFIYDGPELGVHLYKNSECWDLASHPLNDSTGTLHFANREDIMSAHSPYLSFAKYMKRILGYPIGLIQTAQGASPIMRWLPGKQGDLYENMMRCIMQQGGTAAGILWYQGCTEACDRRHENYYEQFEKLVYQTRKDLAYEIPFYTAQINRLTEKADESGDASWSGVREAQRQAAKNINKVYMIPAIDGTMSDLIHNSAAFNMVLGERFAKMALAKSYGKHFHCDAPDLSEAILKGKTLELSFENVMDILDSCYVEPDELMFQIRDDKGSIRIVSYEISGNRIIMELDRRSMGNCYVSNAAGQNPRGRSIVDFTTHLPVVAFIDERVEVQDDDSEG